MLASSAQSSAPSCSWTKCECGRASTSSSAVASNISPGSIPRFRCGTFPVAACSQHRVAAEARADPVVRAAAQDGARMAAAAAPALDGHLFGEGGDEEQAAAALGEDVGREPGPELEAAAFVGDVQHRRLSRDVEDQLDRSGRVAHDVAEQLAEDQLRAEHVGIAETGGAELVFGELLGNVV